MTPTLLAASVLLAGLVVGLLIWPLLGGVTNGEGRTMDRQLQDLRRQRMQLDALREAGTLDEAAHAKARAALEQRLVDTVLSTPARPQVPRGLIAGLVGGVLAIVVGGYLWIGNPDAPGPGALATAVEGATPSAAPHATDGEGMGGMVEALKARLQAQPDDADGWAMLARSYSVLGRPAEAVPAYRRADALHPDDPVLLADFADALAMVQGRRLAGEPLKLVERALALDPGNLKALSLAGTAAFDRQDWAAALRHWERLRQLAPAGDPLAAQVQGGIDEARQRAGLPSAPGTPPATAAAPAGNGRPASTDAVRVAGTVTLSPALAAQAAPDDTVFVFARAAQGPRMPLAVLRRQVRDLPLKFTLDDSLAMSPAARLSMAPQVVVGARISKSGQALPQPGDLLGESAAVALGRSDLKIEIAQVVPR